ncbi:polyribonucleotide 5'-hydroxyl-kinase (CLP1) [Vairimorpha necatrix]|uniref:Polynucleotide 5'-hydroxyl-kinase GRC3 n=1 Tax=Vairimorpha necatrix TaxID=6039 RepID=A0AAX4JC17_9MICR
MELTLLKNQEYRVEINDTQKFKFMILSGSAEIKGQELINEKWYTIKNTKTFIFSYTGCKLKIDGSCDLQFISNITNVPEIVKIFNFILKNNEKTFLIVGKGRTTFCTTIINYFIRLHKKILFTEVDLKKGNIFPGSLSTIHLDTLVDFNEHFKLSNVLSFYYGNLEIKNFDLYWTQISRLKEAIDKKNVEDVHLILAPNESNKYYQELIKKFKIDRLICIGDERKYNQIEIPISKTFIPLSGYIEENTVEKSISRYFNGPNNEFTPFSFSVKRKWNVLRIGEECLAPESALPLGSTRKLNTLEINEVLLENNNILGISEAKNQEDVLLAPVLGYCVITNKDTFKILCPQAKLPKCSNFIQGDIKFMDL